MHPHIHCTLSLFLSVESSESIYHRLTSRMLRKCMCGGDDHLAWKRPVTPPTWHRVSSEGSFFFSSCINFKLVHLSNVKHLTCIIFCSSGLQNIYTSSIYI